LPGTKPPSFDSPSKKQASANGDVCAQYYGQGYCTDYIVRKLGSKPKGDPRTWPLRPIKDVRDRSAVVFGNVTSSGHVAYVERVNRDGKGAPVSLDISEMNYAKGTKSGTPKSCLVTSNFGKVTSRTVTIDSSVTGFWLP
jgi:hypothetical protein